MSSPPALLPVRVVAVYRSICASDVIPVLLLLLPPFGLLGIHHLYLKNYGRFFLFFCTFGVWTLGWLYDLLHITDYIQPHKDKQQHTVRVNTAQTAPAPVDDTPQSVSAAELLEQMTIEGKKEHRQVEKEENQQLLQQQQQEAGAADDDNDSSPIDLSSPLQHKLLEAESAARKLEPHKPHVWRGDVQTEMEGEQNNHTNTYIRKDHLDTPNNNHPAAATSTAETVDSSMDDTPSVSGSSPSSPSFSPYIQSDSVYIKPVADTHHTAIPPVLLSPSRSRNIPAAENSLQHHSDVFIVHSHENNNSEETQAQQESRNRRRQKNRK